MDKSNSWSLHLVNGGFLVDKWWTMNKCRWDVVHWKDPVLADSPVRCCDATTADRWLQQMYGETFTATKDKSSWDVEELARKSPAHTLHNLVSIYVYTFIPFSSGVTVSKIISVLKHISASGQFLRVYIHDMYDVAAIQTAMKGTNLEWMKSIVTNACLSSLRRQIEQDATGHPNARPRVALSSVVTHVERLFPSAYFDQFLIEKFF